MQTGVRSRPLRGAVLPFLLSLPSLGLQLVLHVLDVPGQAVAVEVVVTGCFGKGFLLLEGGWRWDTVRHSLSLSPYVCHLQTPRSQE